MRCLNYLLIVLREHEAIVGAHTDDRGHEPERKYRIVWTQAEALEVPLVIEHLRMLQSIQDITGDKIDRQGRHQRFVKVHLYPWSRFKISEETSVIVGLYENPFLVLGDPWPTEVFGIIVL